MDYKAAETRYDTMQYNQCGESGLKLPAISLGLWYNFGDRDSFENMRKMCFTAFDHGITHFDIANNYGPGPGSAEANFGKILNQHLKAYRDELVISTKAGFYMWPGPYGDSGSKKYLVASLDQSLQRLGLDYVDIFYHHRMCPEVPLYETMWALASLVKSGKALYVGLSNYDGETMQKAAQILRELHCPFVINQNRYSILDRTVERNGIQDATVEEKKGMIVFSPLEQGLLTNKYANGIPQTNDGRVLDIKSIEEETFEKIKKLNLIATERGQTLAQLALSWVYSRPGVTSVLMGASRPEQIIENIKMISNAQFDADTLKRIDEISM